MGRGLHDGGHEPHVQPSHGAQRLRPLILPRVQQQKAHGLDGIGDVIAGHAVADVVLYRQHLAGFAQGLRLVLFQPHQLRQRPKAGYAVVAFFHQRRAHFALQLRRFGRSPGVRPVNGPAYRPVILAQQNGGVGGRVQRQRRHVLGRDAGLFQQLPDVGAGGVVAVLRVLLRPAVFRVISGIFPAGGRGDHTVLPQ